MYYNKLMRESRKKTWRKRNIGTQVGGWKKSQPDSYAANLKYNLSKPELVSGTKASIKRCHCANLISKNLDVLKDEVKTNDSDY